MAPYRAGDLPNQAEIALTEQNGPFATAMPLTPSDRIRVIQEIHQHLIDLEWHFIDITLKQFALPSSSNWDGGTKSQYVLHRIGDASDDALGELARHFGVALPAASSSGAPTFWRNDSFKLFISHLAAHRSFVA
jgi:hypothetical protein